MKKKICFFFCQRFLSLNEIKNKENEKEMKMTKNKKKKINHQRPKIILTLGNISGKFLMNKLKSQQF